MKELEKYLISFLTNCPESSDVVNSIGYTADESAFNLYKLVIIPSGFFNDSVYGKKCSMPVLPVQYLDDLPILYGKPFVEKKNRTIILHADLLASAYFFLSSYEEWMKPYCCDENGRFQGQESILYKLGFVNKPIVDKYGRALCELLREAGVNLPHPSAKINKIYLTHDVDVPFTYRTCKNLGSAALRSVKNRKNELKESLKVFTGKLETDPAFTFPWIISRNDELQKISESPVETVFFIKAGKYNCYQDKPCYNLNTKDIQFLFNIIKKAGSTIGLHASYYSADHPEVIANEKQELEKYAGETVRFNRNHYLRIRSITNLEYLLNAGITDDFTMGFADVSGFRLGTCKPVKWINPATREVTGLTLHPLNIMDATLSEPGYMNLTVEEAYNYTVSLINEVKMYNGDLTLLWHNNRLSTTCDYNHRKLYAEILNYLENID